MVRSKLANAQKDTLQSLADSAGITGLPSKPTKKHLGEALEAHLTAHPELRNDSTFKEYFPASSSTSTSPVKKAITAVAEKIQGDPTSETEAPVAKKPRRKTTAGGAEESADSTSVVKTPAPAERRKSILGTQSPPLSPQVITQAWDTGKTKIDAAFKQAYEQLGATAWFESARDSLSGPDSIIFLATLFEAFALRGYILPSKKAGDLPGIPYVYPHRVDVNIPDIFLLLEPTKFWAPFTLWLLTSIVLPLIASYFINLTSKHASSHSYGTRRASAEKGPQNDLFIFNIAKGLISYLVYAEHFQLFGLFSNYTIATINEGLYGGYAGILTTTGIGAAASLYDAVLKK